MKNNSKTIVIVLLVFFVLIGENDSQDVKNITNQTGTIKLLIKELALFVIIPDSLTGNRFLPDSIPDQFRIDGCRIIFGGVIGEAPANQRLPGTPLKISKIDFEE